MRLIDADALSKLVGEPIEVFLRRLDLQLPPTVDAEPVVRCRDCKHREVQVDGVFRYEMCGIRSEIINLDGFCHMGKRREDAETN